MSVQNNSARTIDGLDTLQCDIINVVSAIEINGDNGVAGQILTSTGTETQYASLSSLLADLTLSSPLSYVAGSAYNGEDARQIQIADGAIGNAKLENSTISGINLGSSLNQLTLSAPLSFSSGADYDGGTARTIQLSLNALSVSSPLSFSSGSEYDGGTARTLQISNIPNSDLQNSTISGKALGTNLENLHIGNGLLGLDLGTATSATEYNGNANIAVAVNPKSGGGLTADGTGLYLTNDTISGRPLGTSLNQLTLSSPLSFHSGADYDGGTARTIQIGNIPNSDLQNSTISGVSLGSDLQNLTAGTGLEYDTGTTYNGGTAKALHLKPEHQTISDRIFYEDTGVGAERYIFVINSGDWRPNDDSSFYNISIDDDINKLTGRGRTMNTSLEAMGVFTIPQGWTPTGIFVDVRDGSGNAEPETLNVYKVRNWNGVNSASGPDVMLGSSTTNTERTFTGSYGASTSQYCLLVKVHLNSTIDYIGGGYIVLTAPTGDDY